MAYQGASTGVLSCALLLAAAGACGRINFDSLPESEEGAIDAAPAIDAPGAALGIDPSFGSDGIVVIDQGGVDNLDFSVHGLAVQSDGRILLSGVGGAAPDTDAMVVRLFADGAIDPSFGSAGIALVSYGVNALGQGLGLQADGRIVLAISAEKVPNLPSSAVARLLSDGSLDTSFGNGGLAEVNFSGSNDSSNGVLVSADQKIVFGGQTCCAAEGWDFTSVRLNSNGTLDASFGNAGFALRDFVGGDEFGSPVAILADGSTYSSGSTFTGGGNSFDFAISKLTPAGLPDSSFGKGGVVNVDFGASTDRAGDLAVYPDGRLLVVGHANEGPAGADVAVVRLLPDGTLDTSFGSGGWVNHDAGGDEVLRATLLLPDGRIVAAGRSDRTGNQDMVVFVFLDDGSLDPAVGDGGVIAVDVVTGQDDAAWGLALDSQGRVLVFGETHDGDQGDLVLLRLIL